MKYLVLVFIIINAVTVCFSQHGISSMKENVITYKPVNDFDFRKISEIDKVNLAVKSLLSSNNDTLLANGRLSFFVEQTVLPRYGAISDGYSMEGDNLYTYVLGELIDGKKNGYWLVRQFGEVYLNADKVMNYSNNMLDGDFFLYNAKDKLIDTLTFKEGTGLYLDYYPESGVLKVKGRLHKGKREGRWSYYSEKGELLKVDVYRDGLSLTGV
ncbi:hypothetical protein OAT16_08000 [Prolixibacteraceae bacterium]|nr:hypothetical protein [Prolixibacteraceae bacterium]